MSEGESMEDVSCRKGEEHGGVVARPRDPYVNQGVGHIEEHSGGTVEFRRGHDGRRRRKGQFQ